MAVTVQPDSEGNRTHYDTKEIDELNRIGTP